MDPPSLFVRFSLPLCVALMLLNLRTFHEERVSGRAEASIKCFSRKIHRWHVLSCWAQSLPPTEADLHEVLARFASVLGQGVSPSWSSWPAQLTGLHMCLLENHVCAQSQAHAVRTSWQVRF